MVNKGGETDAAAETTAVAEFDMRAAADGRKFFQMSYCCWWDDVESLELLRLMFHTIESDIRLV